MKRASAIGMIIGAGLLFSFWFWWGKPFQSHVPWYDRVREDITALAHKRPPEMSKGQWQFVVGWTLQLHANCGSTVSRWIEEVVTNDRKFGLLETNAAEPELPR